MVRVKTPCFWDISKRAPDLSSVLPLYQVTLVGLCVVSHRRVMVPSSSASQSFRALVNVWTGSVKRMEQIFYIYIYIYIFNKSTIIYYNYAFHVSSRIYRKFSRIKLCLSIKCLFYSRRVTFDLQPGLCSGSSNHLAAVLP